MYTVLWLEPVLTSNTRCNKGCGHHGVFQLALPALGTAGALEDKGHAALLKLVATSPIVRNSVKWSALSMRTAAVTNSRPPGQIARCKAFSASAGSGRCSSNSQQKAASNNSGTPSLWAMKSCTRKSKRPSPQPVRRCKARAKRSALVHNGPNLRRIVLKIELTDRQQRELDYHREHSKLHQSVLSKPFSWDVLHHPGRRWWNAYWGMYDYLVKCDVKDKKVLVVGCGFGDDALRLAKLGADVSAFDLSPDSLQIAKALAFREGLTITFDEMPAEKMSYQDNSFDYILARDILHHVDIPGTMGEIVRVAKPDSIFLVNEIYSHSFTDTIRHSALVEKVLYPKMRRLIYGPGKPYITEDERKLSEADIKQILLSLQPLLFTKEGLAESPKPVELTAA